MFLKFYFNSDEVCVRHIKSIYKEFQNKYKVWIFFSIQMEKKNIRLIYGMQNEMFDATVSRDFVPQVQSLFNIHGSVNLYESDFSLFLSFSPFKTCFFYCVRHKR